MSQVQESSEGSESRVLTANPGKRRPASNATAMPIRKDRNMGMPPNRGNGITCRSRS